MQTQYEPMTESQWSKIAEYLPIHRKRKHKLRDVVDAILWILRTGVQWRNLPINFPPWQSVYYYFRLWKKDGTLVRMNEGLNIKERQSKLKSASPSLLNIDSQSVKVSSFIGSDVGIDGNKKINGRKRHIITDTLGLVWSVVITPANEPDGKVGQRVVEPLVGYLHRLKKILADAAYKKTFMDWVEEKLLGVKLEISSRPPSQKGFIPIKWRWIVEQTFGRFNFFRRLDKDYEKTVESAESWVFWQNCQTILNRCR